MRIVGFISEKKVLAEVTPQDLAGLAGLSGTHMLSDKLDDGIKYNSFTPKIVGSEIKVTSIFKDAMDALTLHKEAQSAAKTLKAASSRFLGFFKND